MPGASYIRGKLVNQALLCRKLLDVDIDKRVREVLKLVKKVAPLGIPENAPETTLDSKETAQLLRHIAASSIVLLKNENEVLPLKKDKSVSAPWCVQQSPGPTDLVLDCCYWSQCQNCCILWRRLSFSPPVLRYHTI